MRPRLFKPKKAPDIRVRGLFLKAWTGLVLLFPVKSAEVFGDVLSGNGVADVLVRNLATVVCVIEVRSIDYSEVNVPSTAF